MAAPKTDRLRGDLWAVVSASATGSGLVIAKTALVSLTTITFNTYVYFIGSVIALIDAIISGKVRQTLLITRRQLFFLFIIACFFSGSTYCLFTAISLSQPATVSFLSRLELVWTIFLAAIFLKERINLAESSGLILVIAGIVVMRYGASMELSRAVALVVFATILTAASEVLLKSQIHRIDYRSIIFYRGIFMTAIFIFIGLFTGQIMWVTDVRLLLIMAVSGLFLPYLGRLGYLKAMKAINVSRASIIVQSQPFFAAAAALAILGTFPPMKEVIGGLLIVAGVITIKVIERRTQLT